MAVLGAEQIQKPNKRSRYFDKYMVAVNTGSVIARLSFSFTQPDKSDNYYYIVYVVATIAVIISVILFVIGWRYYKHVKPYDSVITNCCPVAINAYQTRRQYGESKRAVSRTDTSFSTSKPVNTIGIVRGHNAVTGIDQERLRFLDFAKAINGGKFHDRIVDDVKSLRSGVVVFAFFIPYFIIYSQAS